MAAAYSIISGGKTASELLQPDTGLLQHVRVLMALKLQKLQIHCEGSSLFMYHYLSRPGL